MKLPFGINPCGLFMFCASAFGDYQSGLDAYNSGDYASAMSEWKTVVKTEPAREDLAVYREALYGIAMLYWQGQGVDQDYVVSSVWLKQAADINHPGAQAKLGYLYLSGDGGVQNLGEAERYLRMAAAQGDPDAQHNLAILEREGTIPAAEEPAIAVQPPEPEPPAAAPPGRDAGEDWIRQRNRDHYTIQVIALSAPDKLRAFIAEHPGWSPFAIYRQTRYQKPLWVMVQGDYADVEAARAAKAAFPEGFQARDKLWIRRFEMVQRLLE